MIFQIASVISSVRDIINSLSNTIVNIVLAILIFLIGFIVGKLLGKFVFTLLNEIEINKFIKKATGLRINADHIISNLLSYTIYFLSLVAALDQIGITNIILYLLSGTIILVLLLSFFLAIRDLIPNLIAGIYLYSKDSLKEGMKIEVNDIKGEILQVDLFQTKIKTKKGDILFLPNSMMANSQIKIKKK